MFVGIDFAHEFSIEYWNYSDNVNFPILLLILLIYTLYLGISLCKLSWDISCNPFNLQIVLLFYLSTNCSGKCHLTLSIYKLYRNKSPLLLGHQQWHSLKFRSIYKKAVVLIVLIVDIIQECIVNMLFGIPLQESKKFRTQNGSILSNNLSNGRQINNVLFFILQKKKKLFHD